jgi:hypothetical protein
MKVLNWIIALLGLWEFGDVAALFVPDFGHIPAFMWNHILVGFLLMIVGVCAARTRSTGTAKTLDWIAAALGAWLMIASLILGNNAAAVGLWNDIIVGAAVFILAAWAALTAPQDASK